MYYYSKNSRSKIIHAEDCRYHLAIEEEHLGTFQTLAEAHAAGYRLCKVCNPLIGLFHTEEEALMKICGRRGSQSVFAETSFLFLRPGAVGGF